MKVYIMADEWYPWFEIEDTERYSDCEVEITEEQFKQLKEMRGIAEQYHQILKGLHREWKDD